LLDGHLQLPGPRLHGRSRRSRLRRIDASAKVNLSRPNQVRALTYIGAHVPVAGQTLLFEASHRITSTLARFPL